MAQICTPREQQLRRFVASMSPRSHGLAVLKIPRWDGANLESRGARVTQIRGLKVATLRPFGRSQSWRATVRQIWALEVATLRPFARSRGLKVTTLRPLCRSQSWRATVTQIRALEVVYMYKLPIDRLNGSYCYGG